MKLAITGGTGFVGRHVIRIAREKGHSVTALARSPQPAADGVMWVDGAIDPPRNLAALMDGADAVIHIAGAINASNRAGFASCNIDGTVAVAAAAQEAGIKRFVHVSSLAAREPALSDYGWSKAEAERKVEGSGLDWTIIRPPAIYGPGDREMLTLFRMAKKGIMLLPPPGRLSLIAVEDLARLLIACARQSTAIRKIYEVDDGVVRGWSHRDMARAIGDAIGKRPLCVPLPSFVLSIAARAERLRMGNRAKLTPDRVRYFTHPDWVSRRSMAPPQRLWKPKIDTPAGLKATAALYLEAGWL